MATVSWKDAVNGNWTLAADWNTGTAPGASDDAVIAVPGPYTVSLTTPITVRSVSIGDNAATLAVLDPGGAETITGDLTNAGVFNVDEGENQGGSSVKVGGTLTNSGLIDVGTNQFGDFNLSAPTTLTAAALANTGTINISGNNTSGTTNQASLNVGAAAPGTLTGAVNLVGDALLQFASGAITDIGTGATLTVNGAQSRVAVAGTTDSNSALAVLAANAGVFTLGNGSDLADHATADLANSGIFSVFGGSTLAIDAGVGFNNAGQLNLDQGEKQGGSSITLGGTLTNSGTVIVGTNAFGDFNLSAPTTLTAAALANTGTIDISGNSTAGSTNQATLNITAQAAPSTLTGAFNLVGDALLEYASGAIVNIGTGATLTANGAQSRVAVAGTTDSNSALGLLAANAGVFSLGNGNSLADHAAADFANSGTFSIFGASTFSTDAGIGLANAGLLTVDEGEQQGGSSMKLGGMLTNSGTVDVGTNVFGDFNLSAPTTLTATALANTGTININGNVTQGTTNQATLNITDQAAPGTLTGAFNLVGDSLLQFASGAISNIGTGATLTVSGAQSRVAVAGTTDSNSALTALAADAGVFTLGNGNSLADHATTTFANSGTFGIFGASTFATDPGIGFDNTGLLTVDEGEQQGGSGMTLGGVLTNSGTVDVGTNAFGDFNLSAPTTLTAAGLANTGTININGNVTQGTTNQATLNIASQAAPGTLTGAVNLVGDALLEYASGAITNIGTGATLTLNGAQSRVAIAGATDSDSALALAANAGLLRIEGGAALSTGAFTTGGSLDVGAGSTLGIGGGFTQDGGLTTIGGALTASGVNATGGTFDYAPALVGDAIGPITIGGTSDVAVVELGSSVDAGETIAFTNTAGVLRLDDPAAFAGTISTLLAGDSIDLVHTTADGVAYANGVLSVLNAGATVATLNIPGSFTTADFGLTPDGAGGTDLHIGQNLARAAWEKTSGAGALTQNGFNYTLDFGAVNAGTAALTADLGVLNSAFAPSGDLSGSFSVNGNGAFTNAGFNNFTSLAAGQADTAPNVVFNIGTVGAFSESITLHSISSNTNGSIALPDETLTITGTVDNAAVPQFEQISGLGTLAQNGSAYTLDLDTIAQNSGPLALGLGVLNAATLPGDLLAGSFQTSGSSSFASSGLGDFSGLAAGQADTAPTVTLDTSTAGVQSETITLSPIGSNSSGSTALSEQTLTITADVEKLPPPGIAIANARQTVFQGIGAALGPITVTDTNTANAPLTAVITDASGSLSARASGAGAVGGGGTALTLTGDLADLNAELASLTYSGGATGTDTVSIQVLDAHHATATQTIDVTTNPVPVTAPVVNLPPGQIAITGVPSGLNGLSLSDPYSEANNLPTSLTVLTFGNGTVTGNSGATVTGQGTNIVTITGTVPEINADLSDGFMLEAAIFAGAADIGKGRIITALVDIAKNAALGKGGEALNEAFKDLVSPISAEEVVAAFGGSEGAWFTFGVESAAYAINSLLSLIPGNGPVNPTGFLSAAVQFVNMFAHGTHVVAPDGTIYNLDAAGEFLLATSTQPGDSLLVEVRLEPLPGSSAASAITQVAAAIGNDRVTFGVGRDDVVWVDGTPATLNVGDGVKFDAGTLTQTAANAYKLVYNTGEVVTVTVQDSHLDVQVAPGPNNKPGTIVGLGTWSQTPGDNFQLPGGTVLQQPLTTDELYNSFANAWRISQDISLFDYGAGQSTDTFTDVNFPTTKITLADLPDNVVALAAQAVGAEGITDPGAVQAAELDYLASGGDPSAITEDASVLQGRATTLAQVNRSGPAPVVLGVIAEQPNVAVAASGTTAVTFDVYLTNTETADTAVDYAVVAPNADDLDAAAFGGTLPSGQITIPAGQTGGKITLDLPSGVLGSSVVKNLDLQISAPGGTPIFAPTAQTQLVQAGSGAGGVAGPPAAAQLKYLTTFGTFTQNSPTDYTLDLGPVQVGQRLPALQFSIVNAANAPADQLTGTITVEPVVGFNVTGATIPSPIGAGQSYNGLTATLNQNKFGDNSEKITFTPQDVNISGFSANLPPITLTIADTLQLPGVEYSQAWGDVHIVTYNGTKYDFQAAGDFDLAKSQIPDDSFEIQLRLAPWSSTATVSVITQVAIQLGTDRVTFDATRPSTVWVDGHASTLSQADPILKLQGGTITEVSPSMFRVDWNTGETMTATWAGSYWNVIDGVPPGDLAGGVAGLQGEGQGQANDFQLSDGTVLPQPLTSAQLYGEFADSWRVAPASSLFDTTATFDPNFPTDRLTLSDLPQNVVDHAAQLVSAAGITDPGIAQAAELDFAATGDPSFITSAQYVQQQGMVTTPANVTPSTPPPPSVGVMAAAAGVVEAASGPTPVTFDAYLTGTETADTAVDYTVIAPGADFFDAKVFGGTFPSGQVTIAAGQTIAPFTIDLPQGALGSLPSENLEVQISAPGGEPVFAPTAQTRVVNDQPEPGTPAAPLLSYLGTTGTFTQNGTAATLDLGTVLQGQALPLLKFGITNAATAPADQLGGTFTAPIGQGFIITGNNLPKPLTAGEIYQGLYATGDTKSTGTFSESLTFSPTDINDSGFSAALPAIDITVAETVAASAGAALNTPDTIIFPNVRVGTPESQTVSVTNTATAPAAGLDVTPSTSGEVTASGSIAQLAPGATDFTHVSVGLDTDEAGAQSGVVTLNAASDGGNGNTTPILPSPFVDVFGSVYRVAGASAAPAQAIVHVNDPGTIGLAITNTDTPDGYSEDLIASLAGASGGFAAGPGGPTPDIAAGSSDTTSLGLTFSTATAGTISGTATLALVSDGGTGTASIDGLGTIALPAQEAPVSVTVNNFANPVFEEISGVGTFTQNGTDYTLDLGTIHGGSGSLEINLGVLNDVTGPADLLSGTFDVSGASAFTSSGFDAFGSVAAGAADTAPMLTLDLANPGSFAEVIGLAPSGSNATGFSAALPGETLTVTATVLPCFARGTRIATTRGQVAVERLRVGDRVLTAAGRERPIVWIGDRNVDCRRHPSPEKVWPVRVRAGAFGDAMPARDLYLSPDHAVFQEGVLIPIKHLIDDAAVAQQRVDTVHYFHVELDSHDVLLAEGLPAESYLDTGNRGVFVGGAAHLVLHPDFAALSWADACAPLCERGAAVAAARRRLRERRVAATGLYLRVGERIIRPAAATGELYRFLVPAGTAEIRVALRAPVRIAGILCDGRALEPADPAADGELRLRLPQRPGAGRVVLELRVAEGMDEARAAA